jgi:hypothetical protein
VTPQFSFPCAEDKSPLQKEWQRSTFQGVTWKRAKLVGVQTGERNGFDVLDVDPAGVGWYSQNFDAIPATWAQSTPRGLHLFFRHAPGLRCSTSRIAPGVDVRAEGGYVIHWRREGLPFEEHPICDWPAWLLEEATRKDAGFKAYPTKGKGVEGVEGVEVEGATAALREIDPRMFNKKGELWFNFMMGCRAVGIGCEDFIDWSTQDPDYAGDGELIRARWNSATVFHGGAFYAQLKASGIKLKGPNDVSHKPNDFLLGRARPKTPHPPSTVSARPSASHWLARVSGLRASLRRDQCEASLFSYACLYAEILYEEGAPRPTPSRPRSGSSKRIAPN